MKPKFTSCEECPSRGESIFCELENMKLAEVTDHKINNQFKKGQTLFVEGSPPYGIYCISTGTIKVTKTGDDGKETIVRLAKPGEVVGHRSLFSAQNYSATATAMEDTKVCFIDKKYIMSLVEENPKIALKLMELVGKQLGQSEMRVASFTHKNVRERVAELLMILSESHGENTEEGTLITLKLSREELASLVGTATETLIRMISEFKQENIIKQSGKNIVVTDSEKLMEFANISY